MLVVGKVVSVVTKSDRMMHLLRRATRRFPAITVVLLTAILVLVAFLHRGIEVTELDVDDGGIWVAKGADLSLGHLNYDALTFDGFVSTPSAQVALGQDGRTVTIGDETTHSVASVDVAAMKLGGASTVPEGSRVVQGASTIAVLDSLAGYLWVGEANRPDAIKYEDTSAIADGLAVNIATALRKPAAAKVGIDVAYVGFDIPDEFVVGYGLDYAEKYRNLPFVGTLQPHVYSN